MAPKRSAFCGMELTAARTPACLSSLNALADQFLLDRLGINFLNQGGDVVLARLDNLGEHFGGVGVAGLHAFQIDHAQAAQPAHLDAEAHIGHAVHGAGDDGDFERDAAAVVARDVEGGVHLVGVDGDFAGHKGDFVKPISDARFSISSNPHSHRFLVPD